jgi:hypothetical protein
VGMVYYIGWFVEQESNREFAAFEKCHAVCFSYDFVCHCVNNISVYFRKPFYWCLIDFLCFCMAFVFLLAKLSVVA